MEPSQLWYSLGSLVGLLLLSALFSGSETAYLSLDKSFIRSLRSKEDPRSRRIIYFHDRPRELLISLLIGNTVVNTATAAITAILVERMAVHYGINPFLALLVQILVVAMVLIVTVEISPKIYALKSNEKWVLHTTLFVTWTFYLTWPLMWLLDQFVEVIARRLGVESQRVLFSDAELRTLAEVAEEHGVLEEEEREMIHSIFEFGDIDAHDIMVPRPDMVTIADTATISDAISMVKEKGHSRIPVFHEQIDRIVGILYAKDLLGRTDQVETVANLMRRADFVPDTVPISTLLRDFQKHNRHMAIVVDEYGGTEGLVTLEDVLEEIVGEIQDEFDQEEELFKKLENGQFLVSAKIEVDDFNESIGEELVPHNEDYDTLGGFILALAEEVPRRNDSFTYNGWNFIVENVESNRLIRIKVIPPEDATISLP